jgi:hypothetical protein
MLSLAGDVPDHAPDDPDNEPSRRFRRGLALPLYTVALLLSFASDLVGCLAAKIAGGVDG